MGILLFWLKNVKNIKNFCSHLEKDVADVETHLLSNKTRRLVKLNDAISTGAQGGENKGGGIKKIDMDDNFTHMQNLKCRNTEVCMWGEVLDVITRIKFNED